MDILPNDGNLGQLYRFDDSTGWIPPSQGGGGISSMGSGGGISLDPPTPSYDPAQAPPSWVIGSYAGTRGNGEQISFSIDAGGHCFGLNNGNPFEGYYSGGLLTINGTSSQLIQTAAGLDTLRTDTGERINYTRTTSIVPAGSTGTGTNAGSGAASGSTGTGTAAAGSVTGTTAAAVPATILGMSPTTLLLLGAGVVAVLILTGGKDK